MSGSLNPVEVTSYRIAVVLDPAQGVVPCHTVIRYRRLRSDAELAVDLAALRVERVRVDGREVDVDTHWNGSVLTLPDAGASNTLEVAAVFPYADHGRGYRLISETRTGRGYRSCLAYPRFAPAMFCCFDDDRLRARMSITMTAPDGWTCLTNAPARSRTAVGDQVRWRFATTAPMAARYLTMVAGPWRTVHRRLVGGRGGRVAVSIHVPASRVPRRCLGDRLGSLVAGSLAAFEASLGVPYPYRSCALVFVPDLPPLALSTPGIILVQDTLLDSYQDLPPSDWTRVVSHEVAHAWFGGLVDCVPEDWLAEALATYTSRLVHGAALPASAAAADETEAAPDAAYFADARLVAAVEATIGRDALVRGLRTFLRRFAGSHASSTDLAACWAQVSGRDLTSWTADRTAL